MDKHKGGRGVKAPYTSRTVRVPDPIREQVLKVIDSFYSEEVETESSNALEADEAIVKARQILIQNKTSKRSTQYCLEKLLQVIYSDSSINL
jgi:hypothetical protein